MYAVLSLEQTTLNLGEIGFFQMKKVVLAFFFSLVLAGCNGSGSPAVPSPSATPKTRDSTLKFETFRPQGSTPTPGCLDKPVAVFSLVDSSGSMSNNQKLEKLKIAAAAFVDYLNDNDQIALARFSSEPELLLRFDLKKNSLDRFKQKIQGLTAHDMTNILGALKTAQKEFTDSYTNLAGYKPILVLLSDGLPTIAGDPRPVAREIKSSGVEILTIGLGTDADPVLLTEIASKPEDYFYAPSGDDLEKIYQQVAQKICR